MKKETINEIVQEINKSIRYYQRKLTYWLEIKAEVELRNGNFEVKKSKYEWKIPKYTYILSDLATIKRSLKKEKTEVKVYGTADGGRECLYPEVEKALKDAGLKIDGYDDGTLKLTFMEEK